MKITKIESFHLKSPIERSFGWSQGWIGERQVGIVKVTTDAGIVGWGEGSTAAVHGLAQVLLGEDPRNRVGLWEKMLGSHWNNYTFGGVVGSSISSLDIALWDITGKATGLSVCDLLGGKVREKIPVYATGLYYTEGEFPTRLVDEAKLYVDLGFMGMKTKVGGLSLKEDHKRVAAIREVIGPDIFLAVDANNGYNVATAIRMGRMLEDLDIHWFEEPINPTDLDGYLAVKAGQPLPLAGGECWRTRFEFRDFLAKRAIDIAQPDVGNVGGITAARNVAILANTFGIKTNMHVWGSPVMISASLQVSASIPLSPRARNPLPFQQETVMEFDRTPSVIREQLGTKAIDQMDGYIPVPEGPGLGVEINEAMLEKLCVKYEVSEI